MVYLLQKYLSSNTLIKKKIVKVFVDTLFMNWLKILLNLCILYIFEDLSKSNPYSCTWIYFSYCYMD